MNGPPDRVITVCGAGSDPSTKSALQEAVQEGFSPLALDAPALNIASQSGYPVWTLDHWIPPGVMRSLAVAGETFEREWFLPESRLFEVNGICWPVLDHTAMHFFWRDMAASTAFMCSFFEKGGLEARSLPPFALRPTIYYDDSESWKLILRVFSEEKKKIFARYGRNLRNFIDEWVKGGQRRKPAKRFVRSPRYRNHHCKQAIDPCGLSKDGNIIFAFNPGEEHRFSTLIEHLAHHFRGKVELAVLSNPARAQLLSEKWGVPANGCPPPGEIDLNVAQRLKSAFEAVLAAADAFPMRHVLELYRYHFEYYCTQRWPSLAATLDSWIRTWQQTRPRCVITSQLTDAESQLPAEAANRLGIPTLSVPHGGFYKGDESQVSRYNLYSYRTHRYHLLSAGLSPEDVTACRGAIAENEYRMESAGANCFGTGKTCILVLCSPATLDNNFMPQVNVGAQIDALRSLAAIPADTGSRVSVKFKVHPGWPDLETLKAAGIDPSRDVLPVTSNLHTILPRADLVIDVNVGGSAVIHAIRARKPVIFFWPTPVNVGHWREEVFLRAGALAQSKETLRNQIRRFLDDSGYAERLKRKAAEFAAKNLDDNCYPSISDVLHSLPPSPGIDHGAVAVHKYEPDDILNIDADSSFYYGEIPQPHFERIIKENEAVQDIDLAVNHYCNATRNEYFRSYALDPGRALYLGLCGDLSGRNVMDYGCGLGSLGIPAACAGAGVTFVDSCLARLQFAQIRCKQKQLRSTSFYACRTWEALPFAPEAFDLIILNGVMEWVPVTSNATFETALATQLKFLKTMAGFLKPDGRIFLGIENRFALRYLTGYPEDHTDIPYLSIMPRGAANELHRTKTGKDFVAWTWGYDDYHERLPGVGLTVAEEYAMFPDYRFPRVVVSLDDTFALKRCMLDELKTPSDQEIERLIMYLAEMGQLHRSVYSFGMILRKAGLHAAH